jgi:SAM-dependent methyltransferase
MTHSPLAAQRGEPGYVWRSGQDRRLELICPWLPATGHLLDNGCGLGTWLEALAPFSPWRYGLEVEEERARQALERAAGITTAVGETLPFADGSFDFILSNEVIEHVADDRACLEEMARVLRPGGHLVIFCPNRWYPVEQHGIWWRGVYHFGNIPLVNYLPRPLRDRLAPHVRTYSGDDLRRLVQGLPLEPVHHSRIFGGYDNIARRWPIIGRFLRTLLYLAEKTPFQKLGLSHFLVLRRPLTHY